MKQPVPFTITDETFPNCWEQIDRLRRKARLMCAIARIGGFFTNLYFLFALFLIINGLIYSQFQGPYHAFLDSLPVFPQLWAYTTDFLLSPGDELRTAALKLVLCAYGSSVVVFVVLALVIALLYHPLRRHLPQGTYAEQTNHLAKAAQEAWGRSYKTKLGTSVASTLLVILAAFVLLVAYTIYLQDANAIAALLSKYPTSDLSTNCMLYVLAAYLISSFFSTILLLLTRFIYRYQFPFDLMVQAEAAALLAQEETEGLSPEEITERHKDRAATIREEAIALEKEAAYQKAKNMFKEAALLGDYPAMEHYARHCLISHLNDSARYWLTRCVSSGEASKEAKHMLLRIRLHLNHKAEYLRPEAAPLTTGQKILRALKAIFSILLRIFVLLLFAAGVAVFVLLLTDRLDILTLTDTLTQLLS